MAGAVVHVVHVGQLVVPSRTTGTVGACGTAGSVVQLVHVGLLVLWCRYGKVVQ